MFSNKLRGFFWRNFSKKINIRNYSNINSYNICKKKSKLSENSFRDILLYTKSVEKIQHNSYRQMRTIFNPRNNYSDDKAPWDYMIKNNMEDSEKAFGAKVPNLLFDKTYRSRFGNIVINKYPKNADQIYMSDYIMFNKNCSISLNTVDKFLGYVKFSSGEYTSNNIIHFDRWIFTQYDSTDKIPDFSVRFTKDDSVVEDYDWIKSDYDKMLIVKAMIKIMNETPPQYVNFNSYWVLSEWFNDNSGWANYYPYNCVSKKKSITTVSKELNLNDLILQISGKITKRYLIQLLYKHAKYGSLDMLECDVGDNNIFGTYADINSPFENPMTDEEINSICSIYKLKNATIFVSFVNAEVDGKVNLINLASFLDANGTERTINLIEDIKYTISHTYLCNGFKKEDLLMQLYNSNINNSFITRDEARIILNDNMDHIDYLNGVAIKTSFENFPLIDYKRFDEHYGKGAFEKCVNNMNWNYGVLVASIPYLEPYHVSASNPV